MRRLRDSSTTPEPSLPAAGPDMVGETMSQSQKTKAQLRAEVTILRQQMAELVHDITDPLGVILGYSEMLLQETNTPETVQWIEALERIHCSALRIRTLLTRSMDL